MSRTAHSTIITPTRQSHKVFAETFRNHSNKFSNNMSVLVPAFLSYLFLLYLLKWTLYVSDLIDASTDNSADWSLFPVQLVCFTFKQYVWLFLLRIKCLSPFSWALFINSLYTGSVRNHLNRRGATVVTAATAVVWRYAFFIPVSPSNGRLVTAEVQGTEFPKTCDVLI